MEELEQFLRKIIKLNYSDSMFDDVRNIITDNYDLMPCPFIGRIDKARLALVSINSHAKEFNEDYPLIFRKASDDYLNLLNNFDEQMFCYYYSFIEDSINEISFSFYSDLAKKNYGYACTINLVPFSINNEWSNLLYKDRMIMKKLSHGYIKEILNKSKIKYLLVVGLDAIDFLREELNINIDEYDVDNKVELNRYYYCGNATSNSLNEDIRLFGFAKIDFNNLKLIKNIFNEREK